MDLETDDDLRACGEGFVVPKPDKNPGLVRDCEALIKTRNVLTGEETPLLWNRNVQIADWAGVSVEGEPPRVSKLAFHGELHGRIPPTLGDLEMLKVLALGRQSAAIGQGLSGQIPSELGNLTQLEWLSLADNRLSGTIPPELGNLVNLRNLYLSYNRLTGRIPPEFGNLTKLEFLSLAANPLSGDIPPELGKLSELRELNLKINTLSGCVPDEVRELPSAKVSYESNMPLC